MTYNPPSLQNETKVSSGRTYDVEEFFGVEPGLAITVRTGNGDDGIGVTDWWDDTLIKNFKFNTGITVYGEKVSGQADILGLDIYGTPLDSSGSLLSSTEFVIIADLFDANSIPNPDQTFVVSTGAPGADQVFSVLALAEPPDQSFAVTVFAEPADQIYDVLAITKHDVIAAEPPFIVEVFAEPADQIFDVLVGPDTPDQIFTVTREAGPADVVYDVRVIETFVVTAEVKQPDVIHVVTVGPNPPASPDQIFDVSVGGPDAPPLPPADQVYSVTVGPSIPDRTFTVLTVDEVFNVTTGLAPFIVTVGPEAPNAIFNVTVAAPPAFETFVVTTGAVPPDETFDIEVLRFFDVKVYDDPVTYSVTAPSSAAYRFFGGGLVYEDNPSLTATVGQLITFQINALTHPFWICDTETTGGCESATLPSWALQLDNNGEDYGQVRVRFAQAGTYYYNCQYHGAMRGSITVT